MTDEYLESCESFIQLNKRDIKDILENDGVESKYCLAMKEKIRKKDIECARNILKKEPSLKTLAIDYTIFTSWPPNPCQYAACYDYREIFEALLDQDPRNRRKWQAIFNEMFKSLPWEAEDFGLRPNIVRTICGIKPKNGGPSDDVKEFKTTTPLVDVNF